MRRIIISTLLYLIVFSVSGCRGFAYEKRMVGKYGLVATDVMEQMSVCKFHSNGATVLIPKTVFAVGWNDDFIIAQQHPCELNRINREETCFYILRISDEMVEKYSDEQSFQEGRKRLNVSGKLGFTLVFEGLR